MKKTILIIVILCVALVASNLWWVYKTVDSGITHTHMLDSYEKSEKALTQALSLLPVVAQDSVSREKIIKAASLSNYKIDFFEKDGFIWVDEIGLKFNKEDRLIEARRAWSQ